MNWWVTTVLEHAGPMTLISWVFWVIFSICLHELGHGWAAIRLGDRTPIETGHMTWNPLVHMGPFSLAMFALIGIAWGLMPVDFSRTRGRYSGALVAAAGPMVNLLLAALLLTSGAAWIVATDVNGWNLYLPTSTFRGNMSTFLFTGGMLNAILFVINLAPLPPLDGSRILADFIPPLRRLYSNPSAAHALSLLFILYFILGMRPLQALSTSVSSAFYFAMISLFSGGNVAGLTPP
ncbi:MAG: site-2 protease family protein [Phycisphaeraceae bacterium]|nr:site-2 protease family protein [Phycisphaeraceae bacterium]